jgi:hypothetical protein
MKLKGEEIEKLHAQWRLEVKARGKDPEIVSFFPLFFFNLLTFMTCILA